MARTAVTLNFGDVCTTTLQYWHRNGKIADQIFNGLPTFRYFKERKKSIPGGERIYVPVMYAKNSTAASYRMYDALSMTPTETHTIATYDWKQYAVGIFIAGLEMRANKGSDTQMMDLLEARTSNGITSLTDKLNTDIWGAGGGNNAKEILSLQQIISTTPTTGTVGGINRANETWWRNKQRTGGSFEAQGISDMRALRVSVSNNVPSGMPTVWFTTPDIYNMYEAVLEPRERFTRSGASGGGKDAGDAGFGKLTFHGAPVEWDDAAPSGNLYALNMNHLQLIVHTDADFKPTDRVREADQDAWSTHILAQLELTCSAPRFQGVINSITA
jgi:hypothetical protein